MKQSLYLFVAFILVIAAFVTTCEAQDRPSAQDKASPESESWIKHESSDGAFEVLFPGTVAVSTQKLPSGLPYVMAHATSRDGRAIFSASFDNYTANSPDRYLEGIRKGMIARGQLDKVVMLKVAGKPAGDYTFHQKKDGAVENFRKLVIVDNNRVYQLMVGSPKEKPNEAEVKKFQYCPAIS